MGLVWECYRAADVRVLESMKTFTTVGVPDFTIGLLEESTRVPMDNGWTYAEKSAAAVAAMFASAEIRACHTAPL